MQFIYAWFLPSSGIKMWCYLSVYYVVTGVYYLQFSLVHVKSDAERYSICTVILKICSEVGI